MQTVLDEVIEKVRTLTDEQQDKVIEVIKENKTRKNSKKGFVHPNTIWIKEHHAEYAGMYVALKDGKFVAAGKTIKEADIKAKEKGFKNTLLTYLPREDEEIFCGGWL